MKLNADFGAPVIIRPEAHEWVASPMAGVTRMMLDRVGDEVARATSLVRYAPNSTFPAHVHGGGEEILVLDGEFADEHGAYPIGAYLRNPIGTGHTPRVGAAGALIFVKLRQFDPSDRRHFSLDTQVDAWLPAAVPGLSVMPLHHHDAERVRLLRLAPHFELSPGTFSGGAEWLVLGGDLSLVGGSDSARCPAHSWLRFPPGQGQAVRAGSGGCLAYLKTGHLAGMVETR